MREILLGEKSPMYGRTGANHPRYGKKMSEEAKRKISNNHIDVSENKHPNWKGGVALYSSIHHWIYKHFIKPDFCEICGNPASGRMEWSNKTGLLIKDIDNFQYIHVSCHRDYDNKNDIIHEGLN